MGKTSTPYLPKKSALNQLVTKPNRTILDYSKMVPTQPTSDPNPLLVDLMRKGS